MLPYIAFLLQGICQITISIREVGLQFNSAAVGINSQINKALLVVDTSQVSMDNRMVGAQTQGSQVSSHSSENIRYGLDRLSLKITPHKSFTVQLQ